MRERFPDVARDRAGEPRHGRRATTPACAPPTGRYFFLLNSDAWVVGDALDALVAFADEHPEAAVVGPRLLNPDGTLQRSVRGEPTLVAPRDRVPLHPQARAALERC